jgi:hypothetical protein
MFNRVRELACTRQLKSYAGDSLAAAGTASHAGPVSSDSVDPNDNS